MEHFMQGKQYLPRCIFKWLLEQSPKILLIEELVVITLITPEIIMA